MGRTFVGITPRGDMMPCYFMPISFGNIKETSFQEYLDYADSFPLFKKDGVPVGYCVVAESKRFFKEIIGPLYSSGIELPVDVRKNKELEKKLQKCICISREDEVQEIIKRIEEEPGVNGHLINLIPTILRKLVHKKYKNQFINTVAACRKIVVLKPLKTKLYTELDKLEELSEKRFNS